MPSRDREAADRSSLEAFCADLDGIVIGCVRQFDIPGPLPANAVLVGRGSGDPAALTPTMLLLDNKEKGYASVSHLIRDPPTGFLESWPLWRERPLSPAAAVARMALIVEDASPDSVWGVLLLLARLAGLDLAEIPAPWLASIERWEAEGMVEDPYREWPTLASALGHARFPVGSQPADQDMAHAWTDVLRFAAGCLRHDFDPITIPQSPKWDLWRRAEAALRQEEQTYRDWLPHALAVQLSLPLAKVNRRLLIDGLLFTEDQPTGAAKALYRNDKHAPLGEGFTFSAHYRPAGIGLSTDITISLDTRRGVHLFDLWEELERRECAAWERAGLPRPDWAPRRGIAGIVPRWNQPWYIDPSHSLIGAPRDVAGRDSHGSLLTWEQVKDAIWTVYNPLRGVTVCTPTDPEPVPLLDLAPLPLHRGKRRLLVADWPRGSAAREGAPVRSLGSAPVVERLIAALIDRDDPRRAVAIDDLTSPGAWRRVEVGGGFAIVTEKGLFVLDDWREAPRLALDKIRQCFERANRLDHDLAAVEEHHVRRLAREFGEWLEGSLRLTERRSFVREAAAVAVRLAELRSNAVEIPHDADARLIWEALDRQWALERRLTVAEQQTRTISEAVKTIGDARVRRITRYAALVGFPYAFSNGLAMPLARLIMPMVSSSAEPPPWFAPLSFTVIAAIVWLVLQHDTPRTNRLKNERG